MSQYDLSPDQCYETVGTLDIETSGFDGATEDLIAVGVGYHEAGSDHAEVEVHTQENFDGDECELIRSAYDWLHDRDPDGLATFNGAGFDFEFLADKCDALGFTDRPEIFWPSGHVDLLAERKQVMPPNEQWPGLEDCLDAYEIPVRETTWNGGKLTNTRFGEELAPQYVETLQRGDRDALYEYDVGREYTPSYAR